MPDTVFGYVRIYPGLKRRLEDMPICRRCRKSIQQMAAQTVCRLLLVNQGIDTSMIGSHSFRKGIASFLSGTPGGSTAISIYLRAGWSLGPVQSRYVLEGEGGDQVCGRAATGLTLTDVSVANLPPHFVVGSD
jgi:hypothetical protein